MPSSTPHLRNNKRVNHILPLYLFQHIKRVLNNPSVAATSQTSPPITHLFLVGGFAESPVVQDAIRDEFRYAYEKLIFSHKCI